MNFRDLEIGQQFRFLDLAKAGYGICVKTGPGAYTSGTVKDGYLSKSRRGVYVEPIGEPPAPEPREPSQEELQSLLEGARAEMAGRASLDRDDVLEAVLTVLEALVRRS